MVRPTSSWKGDPAAAHTALCVDQASGARPGCQVSEQQAHLAIRGGVICNAGSSSSISALVDLLYHHRGLQLPLLILQHAMDVGRRYQITEVSTCMAGGRAEGAAALRTVGQMPLGRAYSTAAMPKHDPASAIWDSMCYECPVDANDYRLPCITARVQCAA